MPETIVHVVAPHFCAGVVLRDGRCIAAAPIIKWALGKTTQQLSASFKKNGWRATQRLRLIPDDVPCEISWRGNEMRWRWYR